MKMSRTFTSTSLLAAATATSLFGACAQSDDANTASNGSGAQNYSNPECKATTGSTRASLTVPPYILDSSKGDGPALKVNASKGLSIQSVDSSGNLDGKADELYAGSKALELLRQDPKADDKPGEFRYEAKVNGAEGEGPYGEKWYHVALRAVRAADSRAGRWYFTNFYVEDSGDAKNNVTRKFNGKCVKSPVIASTETSTEKVLDTSGAGDSFEQGIKAKVDNCEYLKSPIKGTTLVVKLDGIKLLVGQFKVVVNSFARNASGSQIALKEVYGVSGPKGDRKVPISSPGRYEVLVTTTNRSYPTQIVEIDMNGETCSLFPPNEVKIANE